MTEDTKGSELVKITTAKNEEALKHTTDLVDRVRSESLSREYIQKGGTPFHIKLIDTIRDGGTKIISTREGVEFYVNHRTWKFHHAYPTIKENEITDPLFISFLIDIMNKYVTDLEGEFERNTYLLKAVKERYGQDTEEEQ